MNRRHFGRRVLEALAAAAVLPRSPGWLPGGRSRHGVARPRDGAGGSRPARSPAGDLRDLRDLRVDESRLLGHLDALSRFGADPAGGVSRLAFSEADLEARRYFVRAMEEAGLEVRVDLVGNLRGRREGGDPGLAPIWMGSHIDSVPEGGNFDGQVGSVAALEAAHVLHDEGVVTRHPLEVVVFQNEEGGKTGSRALVGEVEPGELEIVTASGRTIGEGIAVLGGDPARMDEARLEPGDVAAFLELHVEQGAILESRGVEIGVVEGIVGIKRWTVTVDGFANHAGTTPMDARRDALVAAARFVDAVHRTARETPGRQVATVGRIRAEPGAPNVIPGRAVLSLEIRDLEMEKIDRVFEVLRERAGEIGRRSGTTFSFERFYLSRAAPTDPRLRDMVEAGADSLGLSTLRMPSGAGHDAQSIALVAPVGMVFVPSVGGISHSPAEHTLDGDVVNGANVLLRTLLRADEAL